MYCYLEAPNNDIYLYTACNVCLMFSCTTRVVYVGQPVYLADPQVCLHGLGVLFRVQSSDYLIKRAGSQCALLISMVGFVGLLKPG